MMVSQSVRGGHFHLSLRLPSVWVFLAAILILAGAGDFVSTLLPWN
jgi:hypothetical protein